MADPNQVKVSYVAEITNLRQKLAEVPGLTASQARAAVKQLDSAVRAATKAQEQAIKDAKKTGDASSKLVKKQISEAKEGVSSLGAALSVVSPEAGAVVQQIGALGGAAKAAAAAASGFGTSLGAVAAVAAPLVIGLGALFLAYQQVSREQELSSALAETQRAATTSLAPMDRELEDATLDLAVATGQYTEAQGAQVEASIRAQRAVLDLAAAQSEQRKQLRETIESNNSWRSALESVQSAAEWTPGGAVLGWFGYNDALTSGIDKLMGWSEENENAEAQLSVLSATVVEAGAKQKELRGITEKLTTAKRDNAKATKEQTEAEKLLDAAYEAQKSEREQLRAGEEAYRDWQKKSRQDEAIAAEEAAAADKAKTEEAIKQARATYEAQRDALLSTTASAFDAFGQVASYIVEQQEGTGAAAETAFGAWKAMSYATAVVQGIQAAVSSFAALAPIPVVGPALGAAAAAATAITVGIQIAKISSTEMPTYHSGGIVDMAPDEVAIKATKNEMMLTRQDQAALGGPNAIEQAIQEGGQTLRVEMRYKHRIFDAFWQDFQEAQKPAKRAGRRSMASPITQNYMRGLLLMDPRISSTAIWAAQSSYTEAGPHAGVPEIQSGDLLLSATGQQTASTTLEFYSLDSGLDDGSFAWRLNPSTEWIGWETPITLSGWEAWVWCDGTEVSGASATSTPHAITLADGTVLVAAQVTWETAVPPATDYQVRCYSTNPTTGAVTSVMIRETSGSPANGFNPCLCLLPTGRILCFSWLYRTADAQIYVSYSDDSGATWSVLTYHALPAGIDISGAPGAGASGYDPSRLRAVYHRDQIALFVGVIPHNTSTWQDTCYQYCSYDGGSKFELVGTLAGDSVGSIWFDVVSTGSTIVLATIPAGDELPSIRRIPSADTPAEDWEDDTISVAVWGLGGAFYVDDSDLSLVISDDGTLYLLGREFVGGTDVYCVVWCSIDSGVSWFKTGYSAIADLAGAWWVHCDAATHPRALAATWQHGRLLVAHQWDANPGNEDNSLAIAYLGGYSDLTVQNYLGTSGRWQDQIAWFLTWLPFDLPGDCGWTRTVAGGTESLATSGLQLVSAGPGTTIYYHQHPTGTVAEGIQAEAHVVVASGGSNLVDDCILRVRLDDGANWYQAAFYLSAAGLDVWDEPTGSIGSAVVALTSGIHLRLAIQGGKCSAWYRIGAVGDESREWINIVDNETITDNGAAGAGSNIVLFGHVSGSAVTSTWYQVCAVSDQWAATTLAEGQGNTDVQGRPYSSLPVYVSEGVSIARSSGFAARADRIDVSTEYDYRIERAFPDIEPSPRVPWRATGETQATIAIRLDPSFIADCGPFNDIIGIGLFGVNFREVRLQGYSGAWSTLATFYTDYGLSGLRFNRTGNTIQPSGVDGTNSPYIQFDEFAGCSFVFDDGTIRRIAHNSEGHFGSGHKRPTLILEDCDNTEPANGTAGAIRSNSIIGLVKLGGADYSAYRLLIPAQDTVDGYFEIGTMVVGPVAVFGFQYSWGRSIQTEQNREETELPDWTRTVRSRAPARRTVEVGWTDSVDTTGSYSGDPDYLLAAAGGVAVASYRDTPSQVEGLVRSLAGPGQAVVYLPSIPYAGTTITLNRRWQSLLSEVVSPVSVDVVQGEEGATEIVRIPSLQLREIV